MRAAESLLISLTVQASRPVGKLKLKIARIEGNIIEYKSSRGIPCQRLGKPILELLSKSRIILPRQRQAIHHFNIAQSFFTTGAGCWLDHILNLSHDGGSLG